MKALFWRAFLQKNPANHLSFKMINDMRDSVKMITIL